MPTAIASPLALLAAVHPALAGLPHRPLGRFPTRVERLGGLIEEPAAGRVDLWVKRDDETGALYGGNKVRKLEFILGEAEERGRTRLCTVGGVGSHHVLATAIYARAAGLPLDAVVAPQPVTAHVLEVLRAMVAAGARLHPVSSWPQVVPMLAVLRARRGSYLVAPGGSSPTGSLGYVAAGLELAAQVAAGECPAPDLIYAALGSCGTVAGLLVGLRLGGLATRVVAVRVVDAIVCNLGGTLRLARRTARLLRRRGAVVPDITAADVELEHGFFGGGYGTVTAVAEEAVARAVGGGLLLETTYTGKTAAALRAHATRGDLDGRTVLLLDTFSSVDLAPLLADPRPEGPLPARIAALLAAAP